MFQNDVEIIVGTRFPIKAEHQLQMAGWSYGEHGVLIARLWQAFNEKHFGGKLVPCPLFFPTATPYGKWIGLFTMNHSFESLHIQLKYSLSVDSKADVLLHEMVHQYLCETHQATGHNANPWCNEIMRLTKEIWGVTIHASPDSPRRVNGRSVRMQKPAADGTPSITRRQIATWPQSIGLSVPIADYLQTEPQP